MLDEAHKNPFVEESVTFNEAPIDLLFAISKCTNLNEHPGDALATALAMARYDEVDVAELIVSLVLEWSRLHLAFRYIQLTTEGDRPPTELLSVIRNATYTLYKPAVRTAVHSINWNHVRDLQGIKGEIIERLSYLLENET